MKHTASVQSVLQTQGIDPDTVSYSSGDDSPLAALILRAAYDAGNTEQQLRDKAEFLRCTLERVNRSLDQGYHVNALGELQQSASDYDRLCTVLNERLSKLTNLAYLASEQAKENPEFYNSYRPPIESQGAPR